VLYLGAGFVSAGGEDGGSPGAEDGYDVPDEYDLYDWEFDYPGPDVEEEDMGTPKGGAPGDSPIRKSAEERSREHGQFAARYDVDIAPEALIGALERVTALPHSFGSVRHAEVTDPATGERAGVAVWIGFGADVLFADAVEAVRDALYSLGADVSRTMIGAASMHRGLEERAADIKQTFFRFFVPEPGWKMLSDWTILREGEKKTDLDPNRQAELQSRQRSRRLEIIEDLRRHLEREKERREAETEESAIALERQAREEAEQRAREAEERLRLEQEHRARLEAEQRALRAQEELERARVAATAAEAEARRAEQLAAEARAEAERQRAAFLAWERSFAHAVAEQQAARERAEARTRASLARRGKTPADLARTVKAAERRTEAEHAARRARYLEEKAGRSRTKTANAQRREAKDLRARAAAIRAELKAQKSAAKTSGQKRPPKKKR
jgi:hypothetical protein